MGIGFRTGRTTGQSSCVREMSAAPRPKAAREGAPFAVGLIPERRFAPRQWLLLLLLTAARAGGETWMGLEVASEDRCSPYDRDDYSYSQSLEPRILERMGGSIRCRYTGEEFDSLKGTDIEHVVAISEAHDSGLCAADATTRRDFSGDLDNLTLAAPRVNRHEKGGKDAGEWMPQTNRRWFAETVILVKKKYGLSIDSRERDSLAVVLGGRTQTITFSEHISPIIYNNCTECHRPGAIGPIPFTNYGEVTAYAATIQYVTQSRYMPPWPPDPDYSRHAGERTITQPEIDLIARWVEDGIPQGDPALELPLPTFPVGSALGTPDLVLTMAEPFAIRGDNQDQYQVFVIPTGLAEDRAIAAVEFRPGNRQIVHHALLAADITGTARKKDSETPEYGYESFGGFGSPIAVSLPSYTPGAHTVPFPQGVGQILPRDSDLLLQVHYAPWPTAASDQSSVNIFFRKDPLEREVGLIAMLPFSSLGRNVWPDSLDQRSRERIVELLERIGISTSSLQDLINLATSARDLFDARIRVAEREFEGPFVIPADEIKTFRGTLSITQDISLMSIYPHMHLLGQSCEVYAVDPQGERTNLLRIPEWDFNWQGSYTFTHFQRIRAGSKIHAVVTYDNTSDNPLNPNVPPRAMSWGEKTTDEMLTIAMQYVPYQPGDEHIPLGGPMAATEIVETPMEPQGLPAQAVLYPPYPNPFNPMVQIPFTVPGRMAVRMEVFDILGQRVAILVDEIVESGQHITSFNGADLANGIYVVRLATLDAASARRILLLR